MKSHLEPERESVESDVGALCSRPLNTIRVLLHGLVTLDMVFLQVLTVLPKYAAEAG